MNIDWLTVAAQVVNFLILVYLLKRFLYKPVIAAMDRREARIRDRLEKAREREQEAQSRAESYESAQAELEPSVSRHWRMRAIRPRRCVSD